MSHVTNFLVVHFVTYRKDTTCKRLPQVKDVLVVLFIYDKKIGANYKRKLGIELKMQSQNC